MWSICLMFTDTKMFACWFLCGVNVHICSHIVLCVTDSCGGVGTLIVICPTVILGPLTRVADIPGRRALRSACTDRLEVPYFKLSTIGGRAFLVAAS